MAVMQLTLRADFGGKPVINRWHYISSGTPAAVSLSFALVSAFGLIPVGAIPAYPDPSVFQSIREAQSTLCVYQEAEAKDMYSDADFYTRPFVGTVAGLVNDIGASRFEAMGFRTNRVRQSVGRGYKRIGGLVDSMLQTLGALSATGVARATEIADEMSQILEYDDEGNTLTFTPCVLSYEPFLTPGEPTIYRPYETATEQLEHAAVGVLWSHYPSARSQVSRQLS